ncbi:cilia- and flagella-associated protein 161-like isoform X1 [Montipora foliosa]|uniref:cilia- and flagella-associated protein 161-like isoform X1 n=1 Tax=Montipora foliosa TaxID=591990 RepID=UPI0035F118AB
MSVRTYNPSVLIGNWNEDICLEEDKLKDFLEKKEKGELLIQKASNLLQSILKKVTLSVSHDGYLHFGDIVCLHNPSTETILSANMAESKMHEEKKLVGPCDVSAGKTVDPCIRNAFMILGPQDEGEVLRFNEPFILSTLPGVGGELKLMSDRVTFNECAKKSRHQKMTLVENITFMSQWKVLCHDPQLRLETEGMPVPANTKVIINHVKTNQNLAALSQYSFRTPFGRECEVAAKTEVDSHKAETPSNHWVFITREVKDAAREHEIQKEQEFKDLLARQQEAKPEEAPAAEETRPEESGEELGDEY